MGLRLNRVKVELQNFYDEVVVENRSRYKDWKQWHHLYVDFFVSLFSMSYTLGHGVAFGIPIYLFFSLFI